MPPRRTVAELKEIEYWTPADAARVLRRGRDFWANALDTGKVLGYRDGKNQARYIEAASARNYIAALCQEHGAVREVSIDDQIKERSRLFRSEARALYREIE